MRINTEKFPHLAEAFQESKLTLREFFAKEFKLFFNVIPHIEDNALHGYHYNITILHKSHTTNIKSPSVYGKHQSAEEDMFKFIFKDAEKHFYAQALMREEATENV